MSAVMKLLKRLLVFACCIGLQASLISISYAADNDLNGDNKSDLIFRNDTTGQISGWLMNGTAASSAAGLVGPGAWTVTHATDFNGDGKADLLFRNDDGSVTIWLMNGTTAIGSVGLLGPNPDWRVSHVGDFNGDGRADILWRNNSGAVTIWLMNGTTVLSQVGLLGADANWSVSHVADFDGDGKSDLLWRNTGGNVTMWLMNGATVVSAPGLLGADLLWRVSHVADFNGDGKADVLWRNNDGSVTTWLMNGGSVISAGAVLGADPNWRVSHVGDLNGDGKADLVWRNTNGAVNAWLMNGITTIAAGPVLGADANWRVSHLADYNGDGKTDLLWRNNDGSITMWLMNGLSSIGQSGILGPGAWRIVPIDMMPTIPKPDTGPSGASSKVFYIHADHLGTPRAITRSTDNVKVWEWENTEAFGNSLPNENPSALGAFKYNVRMPGQYWDQETGTFYNYFRDYDPSLGRYVQSDPIGLRGGINTYGYADGSPILKTDPFGLKTFMCKKPLHALGGNGARSGPDVPGNPLYHQYLCINNGKDGYSCGGQDQRGKKWYDPISGPGKPSDDKYDSTTCEQKEPDNKCIEQCLLKKFAGPRPRYGIPFGIDCQEWSDDALEDCQKQCKKKS